MVPLAKPEDTRYWNNGNEGKDNDGASVTSFTNGGRTEIGDAVIGGNGGRRQPLP